VPDKKFTIFNIDGWFVIMGIVVIVSLISFYVSLLAMSIFEKRRKILIQHPTGKKKEFRILFFLIYFFVEETSLLNASIKRNQVGFFIRIRRRTETLLERIFYR
jgi:hypothetical protein